MPILLTHRDFYWFMEVEIFSEFDNNELQSAKSTRRVHGRWAASKGILFSSGDLKEINRELIMRVRFCEMKRVNRREKGAGLHAVISLNYQEWFLNVIGGFRKSI